MGFQCVDKVDIHSKREFDFFSLIRLLLNFPITKRTRKRGDA